MLLTLLLLKDYFFRRLQRKEHKDHSVTFNLALGPLLNYLREWMPASWRWAERGNCARWTSSGLVFAELLPHRVMWPKALFIHLMERHARRDPDNVNVVVYEWVEHAAREVVHGTPLWMEHTQPFAPFFSFAYFDLALFAKARVVVPQDSETAVVETVAEPRLKPSVWRYRRTEIVVSAVGAAWLAHRVYRRWTHPRPPAPPARSVTQVVHLRRLLRGMQLRK